MTDIISTLQERAPRYDVIRSSGVTVTIEKPSGSAESIRAELANISVGGAKFKADSSLSVEDVIAVKIDVETPPRTIGVAAEVCWVSPAAGDGWWLGCSLNPPIPDEVLHEFAQEGVLERREHRREPVSLTAIAKWELTSRSAFARIIDCSKGGFCMLSQAEGKPGERVQLQFEGGGREQVLVRGKALWQIESPDGYTIGCEFLDQHDFTVVTDLQNLKPQGPSREKLAWNWFKPQGQVDSTDCQPRSIAARRPWYHFAAVLSIVVACMVIARIQLSSKPPSQRWASTNAGNATVSLAGSDQVHRERLRGAGFVAEPLHNELASSGLILDSLPLAPHTIALRKRDAQTAVPRQDYLPMQPLIAGHEISAALADTRRVNIQALAVARNASPYNGQDPPDAPAARLAKSTVNLCPASSSRASMPSNWRAVRLTWAARAFRECRTFCGQQQYEKAAEAVRTAIRFDEANAEYHYVLAIIQYQLEQYGEAERSVETAAAPGGAAARGGLGCHDATLSGRIARVASGKTAAAAIHLAACVTAEYCPPIRAPGAGVGLLVTSQATCEVPGIDGPAAPTVPGLPPAGKISCVASADGYNPLLSLDFAARSLFCSIRFSIETRHVGLSPPDVRFQRFSTPLELW